MTLAVLDRRDYDREVMAHRFDATLKDIVTDHPADYAAVLGLPAHELAMPINVDLSTVSAATDVALSFGDPVRVIVDLNFQSGPDAGLPGRLHLYNAALHWRYDVAVSSLLVLLRPKADGANLTGKLAYGTGVHRVKFHYQVIRLWQEPVESYLHAWERCRWRLFASCRLANRRPNRCGTWSKKLLAGWDKKPTIPKRLA